MANNQTLLSAEDGAQIAGVSSETLQEYAKQGFLRLVRQGDQELFDADEISNLFTAGLSASSTEDASKFEDKESEDSLGEFAKFSASKAPVDFSSLHEQIETLRARPLGAGISRSEQVASRNGDSELVAVNRQLREEIQSLREEKEWLRARLEKLESRSERDQMLMMSELETIRGLVNEKPSKKAWLFQLPWFGKS